MPPLLVRGERRVNNKLTQWPGRLGRQLDKLRRTQARRIHSDIIVGGAGEARPKVLVCQLSYFVRVLDQLFSLLDSQLNTVSPVPAAHDVDGIVLRVRPSSCTRAYTRRIEYEQNVVNKSCSDS